MNNNKWTNEKEHRYEDFLVAVKDKFNYLAREYGKLFTTDAEGLWDIYLNNLPETLRQVYNCRACRHFVERYGNLVFIKEDGTTVSALWSLTPPDYFKDSMSKLKATVESARVNGVFISDTIVLGQPRTGEWKHLSVDVPLSLKNQSRVKDAGQMMAEKKEDYGMLSRGIVAFPVESVNTALTLLESETLYRSDRVLGVAKWFKEVHEKRSLVANSRCRENIVWLAVANAPTGFCHIKSSMIGTLLEDITDGLSYDMVKARFDEKMNPSNYMRSQSAPSVNQIREAEKMVEKLGVAPALSRRYATLDEIPEFLWKKALHNHMDKGNTVPTGGVFSHLIPNAQSVNADMSLPVKLMTWEKFVNTVLPTADNIEAKIEDVNRFMALVTAQDPTAPNIFQWDNTFSWYYHGGVDAEIKRRVEEAGGRYEDNEIRCSLIWESGTDLDLHCITPNRRHIYFGNDNADGGYLDVDANGGRITSYKPVENIRFATAIEGVYKFYVHNYIDRNRWDNPFKVELEVNGQIFVFEDVLPRTGEEAVAFEFMYRKGQAPQFRNGFGGNAVSSTESWGVTSNQFVPVTAITTSPNLWGISPKEHLGTHVFFLLDGCKDTTEGKGRGFFNEFLQTELKQYRKVLEAFTASMPINGAYDANACGLGFSKDLEWNLTLKVQSKGQTRYIKIDRWD